MEVGYLKAESAVNKEVEEGMAILGIEMEGSGRFGRGGGMEVGNGVEGLRCI